LKQIIETKIIKIEIFEEKLQFSGG